MYQAVKLYKAEEAKKRDHEKRKKIESERRVARMKEIRSGERPTALFGIPYEQAAAWDSTIIPGVPDLITYSCAYIDCSEYNENGIFRLSPMKKTIDDLVALLNSGGKFPPFSAIKDINLAAGIIKKFIRDLPESPFVGLVPVDGSPRALIEAMPSDSRLFVQLIFYIFHKVDLNKDKTLMDYSNLMIVTPTLIPQSLGSDYYKAFVEDYDSIFRADELPLPKNWPRIN